MKILKTSVVFILVFFLVVTIYLVLITKKDGVLKYSNDEYGISFVYPKGYVLEERNFPGSDMRKHHGIVLTLEKDLPPPVQGEGPVSINIDIYQNNLDSQTAEQWIRNSSESNFKLGDGKISTTTISGFPAFSYRWSGLYEGTTVVTSRPDWIYSFSVTYLEMGEEIIQDFVEVRKNVKILK
jgi:hypothetical protein